MLYKSILVSFLITLIITFFSAGSLSVGIIVAGLTIYILVPLSILLFIYCFFKKSEQSKKYFAKLSLTIILISVTILITNQKAGNYFGDLEFENSKKEAMIAISKINSKRNKTGSYPQDLKFEKKNIYYKSHGNTFEIEVVHNSYFLKGSTYYSDADKWFDWD